MQFVRSVASHARKSALLLFCFGLIVFIPRIHAQTATNTVVDSDQGDVDQNEVDTFISFMQNSANSNAKFPTNALGDDLAGGQVAVKRRGDVRFQNDPWDADRTRRDRAGTLNPDLS